MNQHGINETKEALLALIVMVKFVIERGKDGFDWKDAAALAQKLVSDVEFRKILTDGFTGANNIPAELKDLTFEEGVELATFLIDSLKK